MVVARAILGEWLGGSGGGWQDSGGIFPGVKLIEGVPAGPDDPEHGVSRGRLLPKHTLLDAGGDAFAGRLARSLVLVHGGMAQNVGPILNMVTEKYLLRGREEWEARQEALQIFEGIVAAVRSADVRELGRLTTRNWDGPLKRIIPWVTNRFTEAIIAEARAALGEDFWGFLMLGGMSGGGMAIFVAPERRDAFRDEMLGIMRRVKAGLDDALPFAMEPVVYDFAINPDGHRRGAPRRRRRLDAGPLLRPADPPDDRRRPRGDRPPATARRRPLRRPERRHAASSCRPSAPTIGSLFPVPRSAGDPTSADWDAEAEPHPPRQRLRRRPARAAPRRPPPRPDRPGPQPPARRHRDPGRPRFRPDRRAGRPRATAPSATARSPSSPSPPASAADGRPARAW